MKSPVTFQAGSRVLAVEDYDAVLDRFFAGPNEFVAWLLETEAWRDGDTLWFVLQNYAPDFHGWLCRQRALLPPEPPDAPLQPHDPAWGLRMVTAVIGWLIARDVVDKADSEPQFPTRNQAGCPGISTPRISVRRFFRPADKLPRALTSARGTPLPSCCGGRCGPRRTTAS